MIRAGDDFLIKTSKEYTDNFNKQNFIGRIKEYANKKAQGSNIFLFIINSIKLL